MEYKEAIELLEAVVETYKINMMSLCHQADREEVIDNLHAHIDRVDEAFDKIRNG